MEAEAYAEMHALEAHHWWYRGMREITSQLLRGIIDPQADLRILDAGCGTGGNLTAFAPFGEVSGIDYSPLALSYAREAHCGRLIQATVEQLPYADNAFDLVTSFDVLYCREVCDDMRALNEFARVLRPRGHLLLRLPAFSFLRGSHDVIVHGVRRYTIAQLRRKMMRIGLIPVRMTYLNSILMPLIFIMRQFQNLAVRFGTTPHSDVNPTPDPINTVLFNILKLESRWIAGNRGSPAGVSVICLARKPGD